MLVIRGVNEGQGVKHQRRDRKSDYGYVFLFSKYDSQYQIKSVLMQASLHQDWYFNFEEMAAVRCHSHQDLFKS